jgi:hypothetical protein
MQDPHWCRYVRSHDLFFILFFIIFFFIFFLFFFLFFYLNFLDSKDL